MTSEQRVSVRDPGEHDEPRASARQTWPWWGVAAGVLGLASHLVLDPQGSLSVADRRTGADVVEEVDRGMYHAGAALGFVAVGCLLVLAAAWRRWSERTVPENLAARVVTPALVASAGAMMLAYGFKGSMAIYLPGGINDDEYPNEGLYSLFMINDLAPFIAWWGVVLAAGALAWFSLGDGMLPRWIGFISALALLVPVGFVAATGLTGFGGVIGPVWLIVVSLGLVFSRQMTPAPA